MSLIEPSYRTEQQPIKRNLEKDMATKALKGLYVTAENTSDINVDIYDI